MTQRGYLLLALGGIGVVFIAFFAMWLFAMTVLGQIFSEEDLSAEAPVSRVVDLECRETQAGIKRIVTLEFEVEGTTYQEKSTIGLREAEKEECPVEIAESEVLDPQDPWHICYNPDDPNDNNSQPGTQFECG